MSKQQLEQASQCRGPTTPKQMDAELAKVPRAPLKRYPYRFGRRARHKRGGEV